MAHQLAYRGYVHPVSDQISAKAVSQAVGSKAAVLQPGTPEYPSEDPVERRAAYSPATLVEYEGPPVSVALREVAL